MAKQKVVKIQGIAQWAKVFEENRDMEGFEGVYEEVDGAYTIDIFLDEENEAKLQRAGSAKQPKKPSESDYDAEGNKYHFVRKHEGPFAEAGGPPKVLHADGTVWDFDEDGTIGNGSTVELTLVVYPTKIPSKKLPKDQWRDGVNGTRLEKVKVLEHVEYVPDDEEEEEEPKVSKKTASKKTEDLDSEIPF